MTMTFDRRYEKKWADLRAAQIRCERCMNDAPYEWCCKHQCGSWDYCKDCEADCREGRKLCTK